MLQFRSAGNDPVSFPDPAAIGNGMIAVPYAAWDGPSANGCPYNGEKKKLGSSDFGRSLFVMMN